jgi:RNA polymerase sigma-70 factor (ECF subfamily)
MRANCREGHSCIVSKKYGPSIFASQSESAGSAFAQPQRGEEKVVLALNQAENIDQKSISDVELVSRVQAGDRAAFQLLVERYQSRAFTLAFQILKHQQDAEDVVQEAFVKAYLSIKSFQGNASFFTWFYRILVNMAIDFRRKVSRQNRDTSSFDIEARDVLEQKISTVHVVQAETPLDATLRREQADKINQVLGEISPDHRAVIVLREVEGLRYEQIADVLGVSKGTVMSRLHYARKKLQQMLGDVLNYREEAASKAVMSK